MSAIDITSKFLVKTNLGSNLFDISGIKLMNNIDKITSLAYKFNCLSIELPTKLVDQFTSFYLTCFYTLNNDAIKQYGYVTLKYNMDLDTYSGTIYGVSIDTFLDDTKEISFSFIGIKELKEGKGTCDTYHKVLTYQP